MSEPASFNFRAQESDIRAFEKYAYDKVFVDFIQGLNDRAVSLAIQALGQRDNDMIRLFGGRAQELLEIVGAFSERKVLAQTEEYLGEPLEDPLKGVGL